MWRKSSHSGSASASECVEVAAMWQKSSRSGTDETSDCVEVAALAAVVGVRDSKDPEGPHLHFTAAEWASFLAAVKASRP